MSTSPKVNKLISNSLMLQFRTLDLKLASVQTNGFRYSTDFDVKINDLRKRLEDVRPLITRDPVQSDGIMTSIEKDLDQLAASTNTYRTYVMPIEQRNELSTPAAPNVLVNPPLPVAPHATTLEFMPDSVNRNATIEPTEPLPPDERDATGATGNAVESYRASVSDLSAIAGPSGVKRKPPPPDESDSESNGRFSPWSLDLQQMIVMLDDLIRNRSRPLELLTETLNNLINLKQQGDRVAHLLPTIRIDIKDIIDNSELRAFLSLYRKYGYTDIIHEPLEKILARIRGTPAVLNQPPSIDNFLRTLQLNLKNKVAIKVDKREYEQVTDPDVRLLLAIYNIQSALRIVDKDKPYLSRNKRVKRSKQNNGSDFITAPSVNVENIPLPSVGGPMAADGNSKTEVDKVGESVHEIMQELHEEPEIQIALTPFEEPFYEVSPEGSDVEMVSIERPMTRQRYVDTQLMAPDSFMPADDSQHPIVEALLTVIPPAPNRMAFCELKQYVDIKRYESLFPTVRKLNLSELNHNVHMYQLLEPLAYYAIDDTTFSALGWFIVNTCTYFLTCIDNLDSIRMAVVQNGFRDVDRVSLFFIKYNYLLYYRQLISELKNRYRYMNSRLINLIKTYDIIVQKYYNSTLFKFVNPPPNFNLPLDPIVMLILAKSSSVKESHEIPSNKK
ncbi:VP80 [Alphabaculovirus altermyunipunctae]|uniref:VP80 n=1 Tax=Mythimna unipuncta nucleopolyhedrovirus TaxID=447897 RepID=A0A346TPN5_9ABAC|nr:VP80 [Mythimna unipuncta nucleopolyhedrovirus]AXU41545.1 VP80 [Mythimna unipuncta nucleopolyhedrovirus]